MRVYDEMIDFLAAGTTPADLVAFRASDEVRDRASQLLRREKQDALSPDEAAELRHYLELEHLMRLAKARACVKPSASKQPVALHQWRQDEGASR